MSVVERRIEAMRLFGKLMATQEGRDYLADNNHKSGQAVVVADYEELIKDVMPRIRSHRPPVTIALIKDDELLMFSIGPTPEAERVSSSAASPESTIGMLYEAACQTSNGSSFHLTSWDRDTTAFSMPSVKELLSQ